VRGYRLLREAGIESFRITGLVSRDPADAERFRKRGEGPPPRPPVSRVPGDPLSAPHIYVSDFQDDVEARVYPSLEAMLDSDQVDALLILAPLHVHHTLALAGLRAGKHCLVEKPIAITVRAARRLVEAARDAGLRLGVVENARYAETARIARWLVDEGYLGEIQMAVWWDVGTREWSPDRIVAETPWRHRKLTAGAGASLDIGVHWFHRLRYLVGKPERVGAVARIFEPRRYTRRGGAVVAEIECDVDDAFFATLELGGGAAGQLSFSWAGHGELTSLPEGLVLYGSKGCLKGDRLVLDGGDTLSARALLAERAGAEVKERWFPFGLTDTFALGALDFLRAIEAGREPELSGEEGLRDLAASYTIAESSLVGQPVAFEEVLAGRVAGYQAEIDRHYRL
jgi:predicted dehydrogenase